MFRSIERKRVYKCKLDIAARIKSRRPIIRIRTVGRHGLNCGFVSKTEPLAARPDLSQFALGKQYSHADHFNFVEQSAFTRTPPEQGENQYD
ncbi:MAG: hypothetical protein OXC26_15990 [Albidovulum sp.]|nr:hypothetical protein [Albidovulum sp.]